MLIHLEVHLKIKFKEIKLLKFTIMRKLFLQISTIVLIFSSCATNSMITGSWRDQSIDLKKYSRIFVAVMTDNVPARQKVEDEISSSLKSLGLTTVKSIDVFPPNLTNMGPIRSDFAMQKVAATNSDAILTIALIDSKSESKYVPNVSVYPVNSFGYYRTFGGYYDFWYGNLYNNGYYTTENTYYIETNLYDASSGKLVWSTQSESYNPGSLDSFLSGYKKAMTKQLKKDNLITD